jgi:maltose alpha-D-glucosyltransferase/alpha-amylase
MGDNIYLGDRNGVRTPMQWSPDRNAGFSTADPQRLFLPPIMDSIYGYESVNVEAQSREPSSLLNWTRRLLAVRKAHLAFGRGNLIFLRAGNRKILAFLREYGDEVLLCISNLSRTPQPVELDLARHQGRVPIELFGRTPFPPIGELPYLVTLPGHGFYWFRLSVGEEAPSWHEARFARDEPPVLVFFDGWHSLFRDRVVPWRIGMAERVRKQLEHDALPRFVAAQRWFAAKGEAIGQVALHDHTEWSVGRGSWLLALFDVGGVGYFLPLTLVWEDDEATSRAVRPVTVALVRQQARLGLLGDACADEAFVRSLIEAMGSGRELPCAQGRIRCTPSRTFAQLTAADSAAAPIRPPAAQGSNTGVVVGQQLFLKFYRRLNTGISPEIEIGRFLTEVAAFPHCVPVAGFVEYIGADGATTALALLQGYVANQGDGWTYTVDYLQRFLENGLAAAVATAAENHGAYLALIATLGRRTAELHRALATPTADPAFAAEPLERHDITAYTRAVADEATATLNRLEALLGTQSTAIQTAGAHLLERRKELLDQIKAELPDQRGSMKIRHHGDYHLGQVLLALNDFVIIDFEGEPGRPLAERRAKHSPLRDVAGILRSFDYAARTALERAANGSPKDFAMFEIAADSWRRETTEAFLTSYAANIADSGLYGDWMAARRLLKLFVLEKACYELRYELDNRPDRAHLPVLGILATLDGA